MAISNEQRESLLSEAIQKNKSPDALYAVALLMEKRRVRGILSLVSVPAEKVNIVEDGSLKSDLGNPVEIVVYSYDEEMHPNT